MNKGRLHQEDTTSESPSKNCNSPDQYSYTDPLKTSANMEEMQHQSDTMNDNTSNQVKADEQDEVNVEADGNVIETDPDDEVNKHHKPGPIPDKPMDKEEEYGGVWTGPKSAL